MVRVDPRRVDGPCDGARGDVRWVAQGAIGGQGWQIHDSRTKERRARQEERLWKTQEAPCWVDAAAGLSWRGVGHAGRLGPQMPWYKATADREAWCNMEPGFVRRVLPRPARGTDLSLQPGVFSCHQMCWLGCTDIELLLVNQWCARAIHKQCSRDAIRSIRGPGGCPSEMDM